MEKVRRLGSCIMTTVVLSSALIAQDPIHLRYRMADGLPSNTTYGIIQDHRGFLWFGGDAGASRFDGAHFVNYSQEDGLPDDEVLNFFEDSQHRIWFLLLNGKLAYLRNDTLFHPGNDPMLRSVHGSSGWARACEDREGNIWFGGVWSELLRLDRKGVFHNEDPIGGMVRGGHVYLGLDRTGALIVTVANEGFGWKNGRLERTFTFTPPAGKYHSLAASKDGRLWISTALGLQELVVGPAHLAVPAERCGPWDNLRVMCVSEHLDLIYARWDHGAVLVDPHDHSVRDIFTDETINAILLDEEGNCWMSTTGNGLIRFSMDQKTSRILSDIDGRTLGPVSRLHVDTKGDLWMGTSGGALYRLHEGRTQRHDLRIGSALVQRVRDLCDDGEYLFATTDVATVRMPLFGNGPSQNVGFQDRASGKYITYAPNKALVSRYDGSLIGAYYELMRTTISEPLLLRPFLTDQLTSGRYYMLYEGRDSTLWIQRNEHLLRLRHGQLEETRNIVPEHAMRITCMDELDDGTLIMGSAGKGLIFLRGDTVFRTLRKADGLVSDRCNRVHVTGDTVVVATAEGVDLLIISRQPRFSIRILQPGTQSIAVNDARLVQGKLYLATDQGLYITKALTPHRTPQSPRIHFASIGSGQARFDPPNRFILRYDHSPLVVGVTVVSMAQGSGAEFQYRLDVDRIWTRSTTSVLALYSLEPGEHELQIRARIQGSAWSVPLVARFAVFPPFWQRNMFRIPAILLILFLVFLILRYYAQRKFVEHEARLAQQELVSEERRRIAMDLHDDLGADLSGTAMLAEAALQSGAAATDALADTVQRVRGMLSTVDEIIWALDARNDQISHLFDHLYHSGNTRVRALDIQFEYVRPLVFEDRMINAGFRRVVMLLAKETINNALKHAGANAIMMSLSIETNDLILEVQDDGKGIQDDPSTRIRQGLSNMRIRVERAGGTYTITDVKPHGTRVMARLPFPVQT